MAQHSELSIRAPCVVERDVLSGRCSRLSLGASAYRLFFTHLVLFNTEWSLFPSEYHIIYKRFISENKIKNMWFVTTGYSSRFIYVLQQVIFSQCIQKFSF